MFKNGEFSQTLTDRAGASENLTGVAKKIRATQPIKQAAFWGLNTYFLGQVKKLFIIFYSFTTNTKANAEVFCFFFFTTFQ